MEKYMKDSRMPCRYGEKCYQKNSLHNEKYKHPPKSKMSNDDKHVTKKFKVDPDKLKEDKLKDISSDSDWSDSEENKAFQKEIKAKNIKISNEVSDTDESDSELKAESLKINKKVNNDVSESDSEENTDLKKTDEKKNIKISNKVLDTDESDSELKKESPKIDKTVRNDVPKSDDSGKEIQPAPKPEKSLKPEEFIKEKFLVEMPQDFYDLWDLAKKLKPNNPKEALKDVGLILVGPYDVLAGNFSNTKEKTAEEYLIHWRYYYDPPEFQTVLKGDDKTGYHIGYFRDDPNELPAILASNHGRRDGVLTAVGGNVFAAINLYLEDLKKTGDPFKKMHIGRIQKAIQSKAEELKLNLTRKPDAAFQREKKIVTRSFNKIGLVVPINKKTELGYRELALGNKELKTLLDKLQNAIPEQKSTYLSELQPVFTFANVATDECDFGTGIELGWNIICHGIDSLNSTALRHLTSSYNLLKREAFAKIAKAHLNNRRKGCNLSIL